MKRQSSEEQKPAIELLEEAFQLMRHGPIVALAAYGVGTLPFVLALLFFWSDMAHSAFAEERLARGSLGLTLLFIWMKTWQSVCTRYWLAWLSGDPPPRLTLRGLMRISARQTFLQPLGLFVLPICFVLVAPFAWLYPFFTNLTIFSSDETPHLENRVRRSWRQATLWPAQNFFLMFILKLFGLFVLLNLLSAVMAGPILLKTLLGIETAFSRNPWAALNSTLLTTLLALTYVCLDPFLKATYTLRCFYGEALHTGADLKAELKRVQRVPEFARAALFIIASFLLVASSSLAQETDAIPQRKPSPPGPKSEPRASVSPALLDRTIGEVIQHREYSWRLPRDATKVKTTDKKLNALDRFFKSLEAGMRAVGRWINDAFEWLARQARPRTGPGLGTLDLAAAMKSLLLVLVVVLAAVLLWLLFRIWQRRQQTPETFVQTIVAAPDLSNEDVAADELPEEGWMKLAREFRERGEFRLALRALYLATLAHLAARNLIMLARFKSNREYERELARRAHSVAEVPSLFGNQVHIFERAWYGLHDVTSDTLNDFAQKVERIRSGA
jgi:hypothetical protein